MQICFLLVTFCQCLVSVTILALILWPQSLNLSSVLAPRRSGTTPSPSTPTTNDSAADAPAPAVVSATAPVMFIRDQKLEVGWQSLACAAPSVEDSLRKTKFDEKLTGFDANRNASLDKFPGTKFALTCLAIEQHKKECICFAPLYLSMLVLAAAVSSMIFAVHLFAFCMMKFRNPEFVLFICNWGLLVSVPAAIFWIVVGRLFNENVVEKWPFKFASEIGTVEDYFVFPPNWHLAHYLCYAFTVLLALQLCTVVCDVMLSESTTSTPSVNSSSYLSGASSSTPTNRNNGDDRRSDDSGRRLLTVVFQSNLTQLCQPLCRSGKKVKQVEKEQLPSAATSTASAATVAMPSARSKTPLSAKIVAPGSQPVPGAPATMQQQQSPATAAPKLQVKHIPVNFQKPRDHWRTLKSQKSSTVPSVQSIAVVDCNDQAATTPTVTVKKNVLTQVPPPFSRVKNVQQPFWLGHPRIGQQMNTAPPSAANRQAIPGPKKHSKSSRAGTLQGGKMPSGPSNQKITV